MKNPNDINDEPEIPVLNLEIPRGEEDEDEDDGNDWLNDDDDDDFENMAEDNDDFHEMQLSEGLTDEADEDHLPDDD